MIDSESDELLALYGKALDEIFMLRTAMAYERGVLKAHGGYKTFPKSRRTYLEDQIERMRLAASGKVEDAYSNRDFALDIARMDAGLPQTMTRFQWESEQA